MRGKWAGDGVVASPAKFVAGTYVDSAGNSYTVSGPGVGPGGATAWSIAANSADAGGAILSATWYTAAGSGNPEYPRLKAARINSNDGYSFGVTGGLVDGGVLSFYNGALVGAEQTGNGLVISSFSYSGTDKPTPTTSYRLTLQ